MPSGTGTVEYGLLIARSVRLLAVPLLRVKALL